MECVLANYNKWNPYTLRKAKESLLNKGHKMEDSEELRIIAFLLNNECKIVERDKDGDFARVYQANNQLFEEEYDKYMDYITTWCDGVHGEMEIIPYKTLDVPYEDIMAKLDSFMDNLNDEWYDIFFELFLNRKDVIRLSRYSTETLYLPHSDLWLANVQKNGTIEDYANIAKVYGEGIAAKLRRDCAKTPDVQVLVQAFAKAIQHLFMAQLGDYGIQGEVTKFFDKDYNENHKRIQSVNEKYIISSLVYTPKSAKQLAGYLNEKCGTSYSKEYFEAAYKKTVKRDIQKILTDLILRELIIIYAEDKEKFIYDMNKLVTSEENPAKTLEKLNIKLNSLYVR